MIKHKIFWSILRPPVMALLKFRFQYQCQKATGLPENYIVLSNHVTDWDPMLVAASFPRQMYFVASEHIARWKHWYPLIDWLVHPILRRKGSLAMSTVKEILETVRNGGNVALFAEGERSWDGVTGECLPSTGKLIKRAKCGLVTYRLKGGYFVSPRWSRSMRKGKISGQLVNVYTKEQLQEMTVEEINAVIAKDIYEDAYETQKEWQASYKGKDLAESMEHLLFICPHCGAMDSMGSHGDTVECNSCHHSFRYTEYGMLEGTTCETVRELSAWQEAQVEKAAEQDVEFTASYGKLVKVDEHQEFFVSDGCVSMNKERLRCGDAEFSMESISEMAIHGKRGIVFSVKKDYYELKPEEGNNAYKFILLYKAHKAGKR